MQLLRQCFTQRWGHLLRSLPPHLTASFAEGLEALAVQVVERALDLPELEPWQREVATLPAGDGGLGLQPLAAIREAAFLGGQVSAPACPGERQLIAGGARHAAIGAAATALQARWAVDAAAALAVSEERLHAGGLRRAQRTLAKEVRTERCRRILADLPEDRRSWLAASSTVADEEGARSPGASDWLVVAPLAPALRIADTAFADLVRCRLMLPLAVPGQPCNVVFNDHTTCRAPVDALGRHFATCCPRQRGIRHDRLRDIVCAIAREAGQGAEIEAYAAELPPAPEATRRADVRIAAGPAFPVTFIDVAVTATAHWDRDHWVLLPRGRLVRSAERDKRTEWAEPDPAAPGAPRLIPFIWESQGRMGPEACDALAAWAKQATAHLRASQGPLRAAAAKAALLRRWRGRLSVALATGLAEMLSAGRRPPSPTPQPGVEALWEAL